MKDKKRLKRKKKIVINKKRKKERIKETKKHFILLIPKYFGCHVQYGTQYRPCPFMLQRKATRFPKVT
jgi:translation initiation factor IF-2